MAKHYYKNPRQITKKQFEQLTQWLRELGDLSGIVHDLNTDEIISGNQRMEVFDIRNAQIQAEPEHEPDDQGTVARGFVLWEGHLYTYRAVRWTARQCEQANIIANKAGGTFDMDTLANNFEIPDLLEWGFEAFELGIAPDADEWGEAMAGLPDEDRAPFQQMTFTLHDTQAETVKAAMAASKSLGAFVETVNENSNGNALARICEMFMEANGRG